MAFMEGILKPCQRKVLFEREYSAEQDAMIYKCEYAMRAVAINCKRLTANQAEQMDKFAMMGIYNGGVIMGATYKPNVNLNNRKSTREMFMPSS